MPRAPPPLTRITDTSPATVDPLAKSYVRSFSLDTFYPSSAQFAGLPKDEQEHWHLLQMKQVLYRSLTYPGHEVWAVLEGEGEAPEGAVGDREVAALFILKKSFPESDPPTPYDEELATMPDIAKKRLQMFFDAAGRLTKKSYPHQCYHVSWLGVDPNHQGKGLGGGITRYALQRGREAGQAVRLHTHNQQNVDFYARYGFVSKGTEEWDVDGVRHTFWCLVAEPEATKSS